MSPLLSLRDLRHRWPGAAVDTLDVPAFDLAAGEAVFLRGPSGCGKSTLLSLMAGVLVADAGTVALLGQDWRTQSAARRDRLRADHVGYIFQQFNLLPYLSVIDNVWLPLRFSARRRARCAGADEPAQWLARLGLDVSLWKRPAAQLSVGQQQRVACARALAGRPELVIADEPTSALDADSRAAFLDLLFAECRAAGASLLFVSHDRSLAPLFERDLDLGTLNRAARARQD